ncbi:MAG: filamentous hemagglutinin N-terminal domain-containing protein, partial [Hylemonella sp.]|nr:filamentous hemagglutinin N-terminal domain-containing protein [Hylemonella sp.]MDP1939019.1 filamentous hemagglutinin N-terminal domain-containing protein [Hylemonella sp.]
MTSQRRFSKHHRRPRTETVRPTLKTLPLAVALCFCAPLWADTINPGTVAGLPTGGTVAAGTVSSQLSSSQLTLTQTTQRAVIDWQSFNIAAGKTTQFIQPDVSSAVLNRVAASANMSQIYGSLSANGTVVLMNPNGVYFHQGANINVGSLIVTSGRIDQSQFMAEGPITISDAISGSITNEGSITAENAGLVALVAPSVVNKGAIIATGGRIALSGADRATVSLSGGLYEFAVPAGAQGTNATISNMAGARLEGARILLSTGDAANLVSGVINLEGVQQASSAIVVDGNTVVLKSALNAPSAGIAGSSNTVKVHDTASIQDAVKIVKTGTAGAGATVELQAGTFNQQVKLNKANMTLRGVDNAKIVVPNSTTTGVEVLANNVTVQGLEIAGPLTAPYSSLTTDQWGATPNSLGIFVNQNVTGFNITGNKIHDVRTGIRVFGTGNVGSITNNEIENTKGGILFQYTNGTGVTMTGNREREGGVGNEWGIGLNINSANSNTGDAPAEWQASLLALANANNKMAVEDRKYATSNRTRVIVDDDSTATSGDDFNMGNGLGNARQPLKTIQSGIYAVVKGGTVQVRAGTYTLASTLNVNKSVTLDGAGEAQTLIDARGVTGNYGMYVTADDVTLSDFMLYGPSNDVGTAYGIKVSPGGSADARLRNFTIRNVTSRGAGRAELDLNGVDGALIDNVTLNGARVSDGEETQGAGLQLTDSANVTVRNTTTLNNKWGGLALYQANRSYNQRVNNISIEASNSFNEANPVYMQDESALHDFGSLNIAGFSYAVRNAGSTASNQYTWLQRTKQKAYDYAVYLPTAGASYIQGWSGSATTQNFEVGVGNLTAGGQQAMSIGTAIDQASSGATVNVGAGTFAGFRVNKAGLTVLGDRGSLTAAGPGLSAPRINTCTAWGGSVCASVLIDAENVTVSGFDISNANGAYGVQIGVIGGAHANGATLSYNRIHDIHGISSGDGIRAVAVEPADNVTIKYNLIEDISPTNAAAGSWGKTVAGIFARVRAGATSNLAIEDNVIRNISISGATSSVYNGETVYNGAKGIWIGSSEGTTTASDVTIARNQISGVRSNLIAEGILVNHGRTYGAPSTGRTTDLEISRNTISDVVGGVSSHGIELSGPTPDAVVSQNAVDLATSSATNTAGVYIDTNANANNAASGIVISGNSLTGNGYGVAVAGNATVNASGNWWGSSSESAVMARTSGAVDFSPFLMSGVDTSLAASGFQGDVSNVAITRMGAQTGSTGRIQEGANLAGVGGTLNIAGGTYAEDLQFSNRYNLRFSGVTLDGLRLNAGAAGSGIGGDVTVTGAAGIRFDAAVNLLADTTLATRGRDIQLNGAVQNSGGTARALTLTTTGSGDNRGDVALHSGGADGNALGQLNVTARNVTLGNTLWVRNYAIDASGDVALSNSTLKATAAGVTSSLTAGGNVTGATTSVGGIVLNSDGNVAANVSAGGLASVSGRNVSGAISGASVAVTAQQTLDATVTAATSATLTSDGNVASNVSAGGLTTVRGRNVGGTISGASVAVTAQQTLDATVTAATSATLTSEGNVAANVSAGGLATVSGRNVGGTIRGSSVAVTAQQTLDATVTAGTSATLSSDGNVASNVSAGGQANVRGSNVSGAISGSSVTATAQQTLDAAVTAGTSATLTGREIRGSVNTSTLTARADTTMNLALDVTNADLYAGTRADLSGRAGRVVVESKNSYFSGSFPSVEGKGTSVPFINGVPQRSETVPPSAVIVRPPVIVLPPLPPMPPSLPPTPVTSYASVDMPSLPPTASGGDLPGFSGPMISRKMAPNPRGAYEKKSIHGRADGHGAARSGPHHGGR